jgi:hypothetical protein
MRVSLQGLDDPSLTKGRANGELRIAQAADPVIRCKRMARISTLHALAAFCFNTAILAAMINLAAGLF